MDEAERLTLLAPVDALLSSFPAVVLPAELARRFLQGQRIPLGKEGVAHPQTLGRVRVYAKSEQDGTCRATARFGAIARVCDTGTRALNFYLQFLTQLSTQSNI